MRMSVRAVAHIRSTAASMPSSVRSWLIIVGRVGIEPEKRFVAMFLV